MSKELVKFNFSGSDLYGDIDQEAFNKDLNKGGGFAPGTYDVEITGAEFHPNKDTGSIYSAKDPTWLNVKITLSNGGKDKQVWVMVPTTKITFNEGNSKAPSFMFQKFRQFMAGIGESVESNAVSLKTVVPKYFSKPEKALVGKAMTIVIGFQGNYIDRKAEDHFEIKDKDGKKLADAAFESVEEAQAYAADQDIRLTKCNDKGQYFPEVLQYIPKKIEKSEVEEELDSKF